MEDIIKIIIKILSFKTNLKYKKEDFLVCH